jgi:hypothetical protein
MCRSDLLDSEQGYSVNSAGYGTMKNMLQQVAGRCLLVGNVTDPNSPSTSPYSPDILQKAAIYRVLKINNLAYNSLMFHMFLFFHL